MKNYTGKDLDDALSQASADLNVDVKDLLYTSKEAKGLFGKKKVTISVYDLSEVIEYAENYILDITDSLEIEASVKTKIEDDDTIMITIDSVHNPILIGKNGKTLQSLTELVRTATSNKFHRRFKILLDVNGYKENKYKRLAKTARNLAFKVRKTKETYTFDEMPPDERKAIHNAVNGIKNVKSASIGEGAHRRVQLIYTDED
ncbi:MAG: protein jag [Coprobacillus sp.]|nr:protein jag [Coprobacillus sp.]